MKILITGASGFIGRYLLKALTEAYGRNSIVAFTSKEIVDVNCIVYSDPKNFEVGDYDFSSFTHLIHAGAFTPKSSSQSNDINGCNSNVFFTDNMLRLVFSNLSRVIYLSTLDVYDGKGVISEQSCIKPVSLYGMSKLYCEELIKEYARSRNIEYMNLRVGHVYGPGEEEYQKVLPLTVNKILAEETVEIWGDGSELRSFIYIEDVIKSVVNSLSYAPANIDINIVSGRFISIRDLVFKLIHLSGKSVEVKNVAASHVGRDLVFDNSRLAETLLEHEIDLDLGLKKEYEHMRTLYENNI